jgi:Domain of unknown function (DUF4149)
VGYEPLELADPIEAIKFRMQPQGLSAKDLKPMKTLSQTASLFGIALCWGSLTTVGFIVVPMLFAHLDATQAVGRMAARLFDVQAYVPLACALLRGIS